MSYKKFEVLNGGSGNFPTPLLKELDVKSGTVSSIKPGQLVIRDGSNAGYVAKGTDGLTNAAIVVGIAASTSTETAAADGKVLVESAPFLLVRGYATTPANLAQAVKLTAVTLDVSSDDFTIDENDTTNGFIRIFDYDATTGEVTAAFQCDIWA